MPGIGDRSWLLSGKKVGKFFIRTGQRIVGVTDKAQIIIEREANESSQ